MEWFLRIWRWLDGKKSAIGSALYFVGNAVIPFLMNDIGYDPAWLLTLAAIFIQIGNWLAPLGFGHKILKAGTKKSE